MTRDPRIDPQPGDTLVFHDGPLSIATIVAVDRALGLVWWTEGGGHFVWELEGWVEHCKMRKASVLVGTGPLVAFRWRAASEHPEPFADWETLLVIVESEDVSTELAVVTVRVNPDDGSVRLEIDGGYWWRWSDVSFYVPIGEVLPGRKP